MNIAVYQMEVIPGDPTGNHEKVKKWMEDVVSQNKPDVFVLPELWTTGYTLEEFQNISDESGEPTKSFLIEMAKLHSVNIVGGSFANKVNGKIFNSSVIVNSAGDVIYEYDKIHLVPMLNEHLYLSGGEKDSKAFEINEIKMGAIICYDLRFPELSRALALEGARVLFVVAEWPTARREHWKSLLIARAIENQMYIVASNNVGTHDGVEYAGTSIIIDPWGEVLTEGSIHKEETLAAEIDLELVNKIREQVPVFSSRVPKMYKNILLKN